LIDAIHTGATAPIGAHPVVANAIDDQAGVFYAAFGFMRLESRLMTLFLPSKQRWHSFRRKPGIHA
jgi:hypothetical protein